MTIQTAMDGTVFTVTIDELADLDTSALPRIGINARHLAERHVDDNWYGASKADMARILRDGWPEGVDRVRTMADSMRGTLPKPKSFRRKQQWTSDGDEPSWEREAAGYEDIWRTSRREQQYGPTTVNLMATWGGNCMLRADQLQWDGVVLVALCDLLEEAGYRVGASINAANAIGYGKYHLTTVNVKRPEMPLDVASLVPVAAHPAVFRYHGINTFSLGPNDCGSGHGHMIELSAMPAHALPKDAIVLSHAYNETAARAEIQRVLRIVFPEYLPDSALQSPPSFRF